MWDLTHTDWTAPTAMVHYGRELNQDSHGNKLFFLGLFSIGGFGGDGGLATAAQLSGPAGVALDGVGDLFIADAGNSRIRRVDAVSGVITTVAGNGGYGFSGDGGLATAAQLFSPSGVALDGAGDLFIADQFNQRIRRVDAGSGVITTVAGNGSASFGGDGGLATAAQQSGVTPTARAPHQRGELIQELTWQPPPGAGS